ncbi:MAG: hypothetical protein JXP34_24070 [Planctomycetes bacterium]|nr:hypothetical protein [Planctomycetota bacterium]
MPVLPEDAVLGYLRRAIDVLEAIHPTLEKEATAEARGAPLDAYESLVRDLEGERARDERISDERWQWIWKGKPSYRNIHIYGRASWIHLQLVDLL